jgi:transposase-like protein
MVAFRRTIDIRRPHGPRARETTGSAHTRREHLGEVAPALRSTYRNGYRPRPWETRVIEIELLIPRVRQGSYFPSFLEPRRRSEQAIVAVVLDAYVNGVSTRKVDRLVEQMGIEGMTKTASARSDRPGHRWRSSRAASGSSSSAG